MLAALPFFHSFGLFNVLISCLEVGAALVIDRFSPRPTAAAIQQHRVTVLPAAPFMFWMLGETEFRPAPDFSAVRLAVSVGSALAPAVALRMREKFGLGVAQSYGTTESGPATLARLCQGEAPLRRGEAGLKRRRAPPAGWAGRTRACRSRSAMPPVRRSGPAQTARWPSSAPPTPPGTSMGPRPGPRRSAARGS